MTPHGEKVDVKEARHAQNIAEAYMHPPESDDSEIEVLARVFLALQAELEVAREEIDRLWQLDVDGSRVRANLRAELEAAREREKGLREALIETRARIYELCSTTASDELRGKLGVKTQQNIDAALAASPPNEPT